MRLFEMFIEDDMMQGVNAISLVENPAIQSDFVALSKQSKKIQLAEVNAEKRILVGAALIPDKPIYRNQNGEEFYIYFSKDTVRKAAEIFFKNHNQDKTTLEHESTIHGLHVFESWLVEDEVHDKSRKYGLDLPIGSWVVTMKVNDDEIWNNYVKNNKVFGFSIEGQFANMLVKDYEENLSSQDLELSHQELEDLDLLVKLEDARDILAESLEIKLETYNDYPQSAINNAKKVLEWRDKYGDDVKGMTIVGWNRANQLAKNEKLSRSTIARMASFKRHQKNAEVSDENKSTPWKDAGHVAWLGWGGTSGINWAINKLKSIDSK